MAEASDLEAARARLAGRHAQPSPVEPAGGDRQSLRWQWRCLLPVVAITASQAQAARGSHGGRGGRRQPRAAFPNCQVTAKKLDGTNREVDARQCCPASTASRPFRR